MPNQGGVPVPQDVHPQQYQAPGVGAPPGHQWGPPSGPNQVLHGSAPAPQGPTQDWSRRLADMQPQPPQPSAALPYERREGPRGPPSQRPSSPRVEALRQYQDPARETPIRRSPPQAPMSHPIPNAFPTPQALPQPQPSASQPSTSSRLTTATYGVSEPGVKFPTTGAQGPAGPAAPFGRGHSPPPEIKPLADARPTSPGGLHSQPQYQQHPSNAPSAGIAAGAPPPAAALAATEAAVARDRNERPMTGIKRTLESDDEARTPHKFLANGESRSKLDDSRHRRPSPPDTKLSPRQQPISPRSSPPRGRQVTPPLHHSRGASVSRREEQRRVEENYHPSEAAHHPSTLPAMQVQANEPSNSAPVPEEDGREEKKEAFEAAARKVDVDENYDDEGEDEKKKVGSGGGNSPQRANAAPTPAPIQAEA